MTNREACYRGCLLGLAMGDALGAGVDKKSYEEICRDYGPDGILGYDLTHGLAEASSYTQLAAFVCNGLLKSVTRGQSQGNVSLQHHIAAALREWRATQSVQRTGGRFGCWVSRVPELRRRKCLEPFLQDTLSKEFLGTLSAPINRYYTPGTLTVAIPVGMFFHPERMEFSHIGLLGARAVALTHGDPGTFLSGALLAYTVAGILQDRESSISQHFSFAAQAVAAQFGNTFRQAAQLQAMVEKVIAMASSVKDPVKGMLTLGCDTAPKALAGAMYAVLASEGDFDRAMTLAVNHSGRSAAVGSVTGAIMGAVLGDDAIPEFYLDNLEAADVLLELAKDLCQAGTRKYAGQLFDDDWDRKYIQGEPVGLPE